jgi:phosphoserine aminotransferase
MSRIYNFSAGPATLPEAVLCQARDELLDWQNAGMSVMEMSHRGKAFTGIIEQAEADLRELLAIPAEYRVLFLQGGASAQFAMVPLNLLGGRTTADYVNTGVWSQKAIAEARRYCTVNIAASSESDHFTRIPEQDELRLDPNAAYCHVTTNNTIYGTEFNYDPETGSVPLVADMSSNILSRSLDVARYGLIYAGAQKNIGPSGLTVVIVRQDLLGLAQEWTPSMLDYRVHADAGSMYNTPPTFAIYLAGLVFKHIKTLGGLVSMEEINRRKADRLYSYIDGSALYRNPNRQQNRSRMNVPFVLTRDGLDADFLRQAEQNGLSGLKGHRLVGGMRASIYNAMPEAGIEALITFMQEFEAEKV